MADMSVDFCGVKFKNPMVVASIEPSNSTDNIKKCIDHGAAGVIVKTIGDVPAYQQLTKNSKYAILNEKTRPIKGKVPRNFTFYSRSGYISQHYEEWIPILKETQAYAEKNKAHVIGNVSAGSLDSWVSLSRMTEDCGVPMLEINLQHPAPPELADSANGIYIAQDPEVTAEITQRVVEAVKIPVIVKLTPEAMNLTAIAKAAKEVGAAAVSVNSRFKGFATDIETGKPYIGGAAGVGGPWVKPITLRWVQEIYSQLGMPIAGSNGIYDGRDAIEFIMTGARVMQVGSILMLKGIDWLSRMIKEIEEFMDSHGYADIDSMYGLSARQSAGSLAELFEAPRLQACINRDKCVFPKCTRCTRVCFYDVMRPGDGQVNIEEKNCIGCELCENLCPVNAISMHPKELDAET